MRAVMHGPLQHRLVAAKRAWWHGMRGQHGLDEISYDRNILGFKAAVDRMSLDVVGSTVGAIFSGLEGLSGLF